MIQRIARVGAVLAVSVAAGLAARAGTIEVRLLDQDGAPLASERVDLYRADPGGAIPSAGPPWKSAARALSDDRGLAVFADVAPGSYYVNAGSSRNPSLIPSPAASSSSVRAATIVGDDDLARLEIVYERGVWITAQVRLGAQPVPKAPLLVVRQENPETGERRSTPVRPPDGVAEFVLPAGRWVMELEPSPGLVLTALAVDGVPLDGHAVELELKPDSAKHFVQWTLSAPCTVSGTVRSDTRARPSVRIEADLIEPGPWLEAAERRQGSVFDRGAAVLDQDSGYRMMLPAGRWRVRPVGESLLGADPPFVDLNLADGDTVAANFAVRERPTDDEGSIYVDVLAPDGRLVDDATLELWHEGDRPPEARPVQTAKLLPNYAVPAFRGVLAGSYRVAAGRLGYVESEEVLADYEADPAVPYHVRVRLEEGATIAAQASDAEGQPAPGVVLHMAPIEPFVSPVLLDADLAAAQAERRATTDVTGRVQVGGFHAGRYRFDASLEGHRRAGSFVELRAPGGAWGKTIEADVAAGGRTEVELRTVAAARIKVRLACEDRGPIPRVAAVAVVPASVEVGGSPDDVVRRSGEGLVVDHALLSGESHDVLVAGPLEAGAYRVAVKPGGYDRWTWAPGAEDGGDASIVPIGRGAEKDLGSIGIRCGPGVEIVPAIRSRQPTPDLRLGRARVTLNTKEVAAEAAGSLFTLRELPEGQARIGVTIHHPYFLPAGEAHGVFELKLERGHVVPMALVVEAIGGAVSVRGAGAAARLAPATGESRIEKVIDGRAVFEAVSPLVYRVDLCADPACARVSRSWNGLAVPVGTTVELGPE